MATNSSIEWTEATWNPVTGCDRVSPGCDHCYAMTLAKRFTRCGNRMTVVRTGKKGYCKQSYPVNGRRWYPGAACGAPGA